ncbi:MAG: PAS domain S-box protein [Proteobacteria bacterium]|nr:PAS domain S-box protein [Pseudomonadota bacterium]
MRERAEETLRVQFSSPSLNLDELSPEDAQRLFHELEVHQIALAMQNEELRRVQQELELSRDRFSGFYDSSPVGWATVSDVSEQKRVVEETLSVSKAKYYDLYDSAPDMFVSVDVKTASIIECNQTLADALGYTKEEIIGRSIFDMYTFESAQHAKENVFPVFVKTGIVEGEELELQRKDGSVIDVSLKVSAVHDAQGNILYSRSSWRDITERKRMEKALAVERKELEKLAYDLGERVKELNCLYDISRLIEMSGISLEKVLEGTVDLIPPAWQYPAVACARIVHGEHEFRTRDFRETIWKQSADIVVYGERVGTVDVRYREEKPKRDEGPFLKEERHLINGIAERLGRVTERVWAEEALAVKREALQKAHDELEVRVVERTAELAEANSELADFAYVVSHDLKAPLRGISQLVTWLSTDYVDAFDEDGREMLSLLAGRTRRLHKLIEGVLQYSRIGRVVKEEKAVDLNLLVPETIESLAVPENIHVTVGNELPTVVGEEIRVGQVFQNLLGNAIKFMDKSEGEICVSCADEGARWLFSVADNGPGIEEKYHDKIFEMFQTLAARDKVESTGIGLALVKKIVEQTWGGQVWVESTVGEGSTFYFTLPKGEKEKW